MVSIEYANAYAEVLEILKYVPKEDYNKIPKTRINLFVSNANKGYHFEYNPQLTLDQQNTSKITKTIIAILFRDYWATEVQREKILAKEKYDMQKYEQELNEKYSYGNLFKKHKVKDTSAISQKDTTTQMAMIEYKKETFFRKMIAKIKSIFGRD